MRAHTFFRGAKHLFRAPTRPQPPRLRQLNLPQQPVQESKLPLSLPRVRFQSSRAIIPEEPCGPSDKPSDSTQTGPDQGRASQPTSQQLNRSSPAHSDLLTRSFEMGYANKAEIAIINDKLDGLTSRQIAAIEETRKSVEKVVNECRGENSENRLLIMGILGSLVVGFMIHTTEASQVPGDANKEEMKAKEFGEMIKIAVDRLNVQRARGLDEYDSETK